MVIVQMMETRATGTRSAPAISALTSTRAETVGLVRCVQVVAAPVSSAMLTGIAVIPTSVSVMSLQTSALSARFPTIVLMTPMRATEARSATLLALVLTMPVPMNGLPTTAMAFSNVSTPTVRSAALMQIVHRQAVLTVATVTALITGVLSVR